MNSCTQQYNNMYLLNRFLHRNFFHEVFSLFFLNEKYKEKIQKQQAHNHTNPHRSFKNSSQIQKNLTRNP